MPIAGVALLCLAVWAGFGLLQLFAPKPIRTDVPSGVFLCLVAGVLALGWLAFTLAELGAFSIGVILIAGLLAGVWGWLAARGRGSRIALNPIGAHRSEAAFLVALIGVTSALYLRPHEFIFGGADAGVYVNMGAQVQRSGSWLISNPDLGRLPASDYTQVFREQPPAFIPRFYHLPGFYVADDEAGKVIPQFYALHPIWLAMAHALGGVRANLLMTPLWGVLGALAVYFAVRESFDDRRLAAVAAGVLALTPTQIWFARYPTAEIFTQFLLFAGLYALARHVRRGESWPAVLAGGALGQVMLTRLDMYFLLGVPVVLAAYLHLRRRLDRRFWLFAAPMLLMSVHSLLHVAWQGWPYFYNSYLAGGASLLPMPPAGIAGGLVLTVAVFVTFDRTLAVRPGWEERVQPLWRIGLNIAAASLILLALYAYFVRPSQADPLRVSNYWYADHTIPDVEPFNFMRLGWYLSPLGVMLGAAGAAWLVRDGLNERTWPLIGVGLFFSILYLYRTFNNPHHIYVMRRYVPMVFPFMALGIAYTLTRLSAWNRPGRFLAAGLGLAQVGLLLYAGRAVIPQVDYRGGVEQFGALAAQIPRQAIVLFNDNQPVGAAGIFGTPLAYLEGFTVIDLQEDRLDFQRLDNLIGSWLADERPVIVVNGSSSVSGLCDRWRCRHLGQARLDFPTLETSYDHFPTEIIGQQYALDLYAVEAVR